MADRIRYSRRKLLTLAPIGGLALLGGCNSDDPHKGVLGAMERWNARVQMALFNPHRLAPELPPGSETPDGDFPAYKVADDFPTAPANWALKVGGLVSRPGTYSLEALRQLPRTEMRVRHHCVEGWSAVASWHGVPVSEIARLAGADPKAPFVEFRSFESDSDSDQYYSCWDRASALHPQTLLAYGKNGQPLTVESGAPLRLYSAVKLGYKNVKYLAEVNFMPTITGGYWEDQGYEWFAGV